MDSLWIIAPSYNEVKALDAFISEWINHLRGTLGKDHSFHLCIVNDGSTDRSLEKLKHYCKEFPELKVITKKQAGHGLACITGYEYALNQQADWIMQIDADGQCDPKYFSSFWNERKEYRAIFGFRKSRGDGLLRLFTTRILSLINFLLHLTWIKDANVPYRLFHASVLKKCIPPTFCQLYYSNIFLTINVQKKEGIHWIPIHFKDRQTGQSSIRLSTLLKAGLRLVKDNFKFYRHQIKN